MAEVVELINGSDCATIYLHGATVTSWKVNGKELLFLSSKAILDGSKPIRGGIPIVFPQFGTGPIMSGQHGFARNLKWQIYDEGGERSESKVTLKLFNSEATLKLWPHKFNLLYTVSLEHESLNIRFEVENCDDSTCNESAFNFTALLHTYFNVEAIESVKVNGLGKLEYADKLRENKRYVEERLVIENISEEIDRNYFNVPGCVKMSFSAGEFEIKSDFKDLVVWNPWIEKSKKMSDFYDDEYKKMICLEFGNVEYPVKIEKEFENGSKNEAKFNNKWVATYSIKFKSNQ